MQCPVSNGIKIEKFVFKNQDSRHFTELSLTRSACNKRHLQPGTLYLSWHNLKSLCRKQHASVSSFKVECLSGDLIRSQIPAFNVVSVSFIAFELCNAPQNQLEFTNMSFDSQKRCEGRCKAQIHIYIAIATRKV